MNFLRDHRSFFLVILIITIGLSCTESEDQGPVLEDDALESCADTEVNDPDFGGTACCIQRNTELDPSAEIVYEYSTNLPNAQTTWEVTSGDIEIVSGGNSPTVTIRLGDSFTEGQITALGTGDRSGIELRCSATVSIAYSTEQ